MPVILHDVPSRTVVALADETVARLARLPQVVGIADATGDICRPARLRALTRPDFRLLCGDDTFAPAYLAQGGDGSISVTSNIAPELCRALYDATASGNVLKVRKLCEPFMAVTAALTRASNHPVAIKHALNVLGLMSAAVRLPLVPLCEGDNAELVATIRRISARWPGCLIEPAATPIADPRAGASPAGCVSCALLRPDP